MGHVKVYSAFALILILAGVSAAQTLYIHKGIHGMAWGGSVADYDKLIKVHETDYAAFYIKSKTVYYAAEQRVSRVSYGFYRNRLYAAFIKLRSVDQFTQLAQKFTENHGKPKVSYENAGKQIVYRWKAADVKIKLKMKDAVSEYKLAFYYSPLSESLNQEQLDQIPDEAYGPAPADDADKEAFFPLLQY